MALAPSDDVITPYHWAIATYVQASCCSALKPLEAFSDTVVMSFRT
ncbi:hypothetical protein [cf. Phormidesmis sp. LEGE 11477]|nr:hypothetical protein [cf. Phormidesmis sp. LEGE 11477]MBE9064578.1 hypothetical protein [cf. Phormidesmis sp. LEGE 11477]